MQCEVCGRRIRGKAYKAIIERARLVVCSDCATLGSMSWEIKTPKPSKSAAKLKKPLKRKLSVSTKRQSPLEPTLELVDDFDVRIRRAREKKGLSHEDLGRKINEKISVLKKLESHKMTPDNKLAEKLQHSLKIKLLVPATEEKLSKRLLTATPSKVLTLGDLIKNKKKPEAKK
ncbi:MAG: multiprotein bridging factor aMBF1 [Candidatus Bathyarchaeota archaeon]|nr:multiprotein bridging factor aMBF1 [Candidatus Bathyarchaeota archaeon]MDH5494785.1 multiprotein bridging factor aMBF1 [Candidatus Bathyarchaeota archaeon]